MVNHDDIHGVFEVRCHAMRQRSCLRCVSEPHQHINPFHWSGLLITTYVARIKLIMNATNMCLIMLGYSSGSLHLAHADLHGGARRGLQTFYKVMSLFECAECYQC